ncbi:MAG TPA: LytTR family DNA-binding domain-containing protein [Fulvivirga sp.]|nr:LytTR family DNA-binding domain-containing protein [Fulvivirga sp.]
MKVNCLIIDDEVIAQDIIESYIKPLEQFQLIGKCKDALEANNIIQDSPIDLIFLDIEMPHINGLAFLKNLKNPPQVILTTAYRDYALEGFELDVVDYLLKPISQERFLKAVNRILSRPKPLSQNHAYIYMKVDLKMVQVYLDEILYIEGLSNYVRIFCKVRTLISYQKLSHLEEVLPDNQFIRSHRSNIISIDKITSYTNNEVSIGNVELPIGGSYREKLIQLLNKHQF